MSQNDFFSTVAKRVLEMDVESEKFSSHVQKKIEEGSKRLEQSRDLFEKRKKERDKHFKMIRG